MRMFLQLLAMAFCFLFAYQAYSVEAKTIEPRATLPLVNVNTNDDTEIGFSEHAAEAAAFPSNETGKQPELESAADDHDKAVYPGVEKYFHGWRIPDRDNSCRTYDLGSWSMITPPAHGTWVSRVHYGFGDPNSPGYCPSATQQPYRGLYYTWTDRTKGITKDQFKSRWRGKDRYGVETTVTETWYVTLIPPKISIDGLSLDNGYINVSIVAAGAQASSGRFTVFLSGNDNSAVYIQSLNGGIDVTEGSYQIPLNRPSIPENNYTLLRAQWDTPWTSVTAENALNPTWRVLGVIRHTQYNRVSESRCSNETQTAWVFDANCKFTEITLRKAFAQKVWQNGSGTSINEGLLQYQPTKRCKNYCDKSKPPTKPGSATCPKGTVVNRYPLGANDTNSFLKVAEIKGACYVPVGEGSQAVFPSPKAPTSPLRCDDGTKIVNELNINLFDKIVLDHCDGCKDGHHIDNWTSDDRCSAAMIGDLGIFWTALRRGD